MPRLTNAELTAINASLRIDIDNITSVNNEYNLRIARLERLMSKQATHADNLLHNLQEQNDTILEQKEQINILKESKQTYWAKYKKAEKRADKLDIRIYDLLRTVNITEKLADRI